MDDDRLKRLETRLVQLMIWLGADPHGSNEPSGFINNAKEVLNGEDRSDGGGADLVPNWNQFDRPAYLRRRGVCAECPCITTEVQGGNPTRRP